MDFSDRFHTRTHKTKNSKRHIIHMYFLLRYSQPIKKTSQNVREMRHMLKNACLQKSCWTRSDLNGYVTAKSVILLIPRFTRTNEIKKSDFTVSVVFVRNAFKYRYRSWRIVGCFIQEVHISRMTGVVLPSSYILFVIWYFYHYFCR